MRPQLAIRWIDDCRTRRTVELLTLVWLFAISDLSFTIWAHLFTPFRELNPLASSMLQHHWLLSLAFAKVLLTGVGTGIFWFLRKYGRAELALWLVVVVYAGLMFRWSNYTSQVLLLGVVTF